MVQKAAPTASGHDWYGKNVVQEGCWRFANASCTQIRILYYEETRSKHKAGHAPNLRVEAEFYR